MFTAPSQMSCTTPVPLPEDPAGDITDDCRLWIGNLDTRLTEYTLLKLLQKFGHLKRFDFLINKQGPDKGKPKGYCFVSYETRQDAEKAKKNLNGKMALSKKLVAKWAHVENQGDQDMSKQQTATSASTSNTSAESKIKAIEAKLKKMEESAQEFTLSTEPAAPPGSSQLYQINSAKQQQNKKPYCRKK